MDKPNSKNVIDSFAIVERLDRLCTSPGPEDSWEELEEDWERWLNALSFENLAAVLGVCKLRSLSDERIQESMSWWKGGLLECLVHSATQDSHAFFEEVDTLLLDDSLKKWLVTAMPLVEAQLSIEWMLKNYRDLSDEEIISFTQSSFEAYGKISVELFDRLYSNCTEDNRIAVLPALKRLIDMKKAEL